MSFEPRTWELDAGAWLRLEPLLTAACARHLLLQLRDALDWQSREIQLFGRRASQPRLVAWAGELPYRYSGQTLPPQPWSSDLYGIWRRVCETTGVDFNHVLCNQYRNGHDHMGFHADNEPELGPEPTVACVSLGAERPLALRRASTRSRGAGAACITLESAHRSSDFGSSQLVPLPAGSLLTMGGRFQHEYRHALPRRLRITDVRISLTFRKLLGPPCNVGPDNAGPRNAVEASWR